MLDVIVAGAGPAGSIAALILARAGARVLIVERETFPRHKLCGDTLNPGAVSLLASLGLHGGPLDRALPIRGMCVTGPTTSVSAEYGDGIRGLALTRRELDSWLLDAAVRAGARFESGLVVRRPLVDTGHHTLVRGVVLATRGGRPETRLPATLVVAADGRRSALARACGLRADPPPVRRWAFGTYATGVTGVTDLGEMHVRRGWYVGIAPLADGRVNVCLVTPPAPKGRRPLEIIRQAVASDRRLGERLAGASFPDPIHVLGPLAADVRAPGVPGMLLAGDAAGFIDPMTGDGIHLAIEGGRLAAEAGLRALERGEFSAAVGRLADARHRTFAGKLRFNRVVRRLVATPGAVDVASVAARIMPGAIRLAIRYAGDAA